MEYLWNYIGFPAPQWCIRFRCLWDNPRIRSDTNSARPAESSPTESELGIRSKPRAIPPERANESGVTDSGPLRCLWDNPKNSTGFRLHGIPHWNSMDTSVTNCRQEFNGIPMEFH